VGHAADPAVEVGAYEFVLSSSIPESESLVHASAEDHSVILGERNRQNIFSMSGEELFGCHSSKIP